VDTPLNAELVALKRLSTSVRSVGSRLLWRAAMQKRTTRFASVLRMTKRLVPGESATRRKIRGAWLIEIPRPFDPVLVMTVVTRTRGRTLEDLEAPILTYVSRRDLANVAVLEQLESRGIIKVVDSP
jgi:hypothetical protein